MAGKAKGKNQKTPNETSHFRVENQHAYTLLLQAHAHECDVCVCVRERAQVPEGGQRTHLKAITWLGLKWREDSQVIKQLKWKVQGVRRELSGHREPGSVSQETRI